MTHLLAVCSISLYIVVTLLHMSQLWRPSKAGRSLLIARIGFYCAFLLHSGTMLLVLNDPSLLVLSNGADCFLWGSWLIALCFVLFRKRLAYPIVGAFVVPAIVLFMGSSSYLLHKESPSLLGSISLYNREGIWLSLMHAIPALVSVVSLALALVVSGVFLIIEKRLKKRPAQLLSSSGPNLQVLDLLNKQLVQVGFVAISLVIVSGGLWAVSEQKPVFSFDTSVVSGLVVWVLLGFILHARLVLDWSPRRVSRLTLFVTGSFFISVFCVLALAGRITHASLWS